MKENLRAEVAFEQRGRLVWAEAPEQVQPLVPLPVAEAGDALVDAPGDLKVAQVRVAPLVFVAAQRFGRPIARRDRLADDTPGDTPRVDRVANALAHQRGALHGGVAGGNQPWLHHLLRRRFGGEEAGVILDRAGARQHRRQHRHALGDLVEVEAGVFGIGVGLEDAHAHAHAAIAAREEPGVASRSDLRPHDQIDAILVVVGSVKVIFRAKAVALEVFAQPGAGGDDRGEAAGVDEDLRAILDAVPQAVFNRHADNRAILDDRRLGKGLQFDARARRDGLLRQVLIEAAYIDDTGHGIGIVEGDFAVGREEDGRADGVIEVIGDAQRLEFANPASPAGVNGIADLALALQNDNIHALPGDGCSGGQPGWPAPDDDD